MSESTTPGTAELQAPVTIELANALTPAQTLDLGRYDPTQQKRIAEIRAGASVLDSNTVTSFGADVQRRMNGYLDELLQGLQLSQTGVAGELTLELSRSIKAMKLAKMKREADGQDWVARTVGRLPVVGKWASALRYFQLTHQQVTRHLSEIESQARREMANLTGTNAKLDQLIEHSVEQLRDMELYLAAGQGVLERARQEFTAAKAALVESHDPIALARLRDHVEQTNAFEARLLRMHVAFADGLAAIPQIRMTQESTRIEARNIMDTLLFDLPRLKSAIIRVASLNQIINANKANARRRDVARQIGTIGAEALDEAYTRAKESQGSGIEDVAALAATADKLLETIAKGIKLDEENRRHRATAQEQLEQVKVRLGEGLRANFGPHDDGDTVA